MPFPSPATSYRNAFSTRLFDNAITERLATLPGFTWTRRSVAPSHANLPLLLHLAGENPAESAVVEIESNPGPNLANRFTLLFCQSAPGLSALDAARRYFELRRVLHDLLEATLVLSGIHDEIGCSIEEEIRATHDAERDELELTGQRLRELPASICLLAPHLNYLGLSNNRLSSLPPEIALLAGLTDLDLTANKFAEFPSPIFALAELRNLYLDINQLTALPAEIGNLPYLRELHLNGNRLASLPPEIGRLKSLRRLSIEDNAITRMPIEFLQLTALNDVDLHEWSQKHPRQIPPSGIRKLLSHGNPWTYPPPEIMSKDTRAIRAWLAANPAPAALAAHQYIVFVDDNYHHMDETERYELGSFPDCASAIAACRGIVDEFFRKINSGKTAEELLRDYKGFGEDPFIKTTDPDCRFSAWKYAEERATQIAARS